MLTGNAVTIVANATQDSVIHHVVFSKNNPVRCKDGIFVTDGQYKIPFKTINEVYENGLCQETDIVFNNYIFYSSGLLTGFSSEDQDIILANLQQPKTDILDDITSTDKTDIISEIVDNDKTDILDDVKGQVTTTAETTVDSVNDDFVSDEVEGNYIIIDDEYIEIPVVNSSLFPPIPEDQPRIIPPKDIKLPTIPKKKYTIMTSGWVK